MPLAVAAAHSAMPGILLCWAVLYCLLPMLLVLETEQLCIAGNRIAAMPPALAAHGVQGQRRQLRRRYGDLGHSTWQLACAADA